MADNHSKEVRSMNMSHIRSTNSKPEEIVRNIYFQKDFDIARMFEAYQVLLILF